MRIEQHRGYAVCGCGALPISGKDAAARRIAGKIVATTAMCGLMKNDFMSLMSRLRTQATGEIFREQAEVEAKRHLPEIFEHREDN